MTFSRFESEVDLSALTLYSLLLLRSLRLGGRPSILPRPELTPLRRGGGAGGAFNEEDGVSLRDMLECDPVEGDRLSALARLPPVFEDPRGGGEGRTPFVFAVATGGADGAASSGFSVLGAAD